MRSLSKKAMGVSILIAVLATTAAATGAHAQSDHAKNGKGGVKSAEAGAKHALQIFNDNGNNRVNFFRRTIPGKVIQMNIDNNGAGTLKIRKGNKEYTVETTADTQFVDRRWRELSDEGDVKVDHKVTIRGTFDKEDKDRVIKATVVRDVSLPVPSERDEN